MWIRSLPVAAALALATVGRVTGQAPDKGEFTIQKSGREIGRERFSIGSRGGILVSGSADYPAIGPTSSVALEVTLGPDGNATDLVAGGRDQAGVKRIIGVVSGGRMVLRMRTPDGEAARELPATGQFVVLEDSVFIAYVVAAALASDEGRSLTAIFPRSGRRTRFVALKAGSDAAGGQLVKLSGGIEGSITLDAQGRVQRIDLPGSGFAAIRKPH